MLASVSPTADAAASGSRIAALAYRVAFGAAFLMATIGSADEVGWRWQESFVPDVGFDLDAAEVARVTSLEGEGQGSLREALRGEGPRLVVFEVGGVIDLGMRGITIRGSGIHVAGQTAPAPGITLIRGGLSIEASQCVIQHIAVRPGDAGKPKRGGWEPDGITTVGRASDVWIDHCSATWAVDENLSASSYGAPDGQCARRIYFRDCIVAEGLSEATHAKGEHSKGTLVLDGTREVAIVRCLYASNTERNPVFKPDTSGCVVNCLIANPGQRAIHATVPGDGGAAGHPARISVVGNVVLLGEGSKRSARAIFEGAADGHFRDNEGYDWFGKPLDLLRTPFPTLDAPPLWPEGLEAMSHAGAIWHIARFAGARPAQRGPIDRRIVGAAIGGTAKIIDSQEDVGGYPAHAEVVRALDVPATGRRAWLERLAREVTYGAAAD